MFSTLKIIKPIKQSFTAVELMVVVLIMGILSVVAGPQVRQWMSSITAQTTASSILSAINKARAEALSKNAPILFTMNDTGYWEYGCQNVNTSEVSGVYCPAAVLESNNELLQKSGITLTLNPSGGDYLLFNTLGMAITNPSTGSSPLSSVNVMGGGKTYQVLIRSSGSAKMCTGTC